MPEIATKSYSPFELADQAIGLFLEYRDQHGHTEADARRAAALEVAEGAAADLDEPGSEPEPLPLPEGTFGRVELPGYRQHTGWITEEPRFGQQAAVVRDWNGAEIAVAVLGPGCQVVHLPTPRKRPDPPKAITGGQWSDDDDLDDYDSDPDDSPI